MMMYNVMLGHIVERIYKSIYINIYSIKFLYLTMKYIDNGQRKIRFVFCSCYI